MNEMMIALSLLTFGLFACNVCRAASAGQEAERVNRVQERVSRVAVRQNQAQTIRRDALRKRWNP